MKQNYKTHIFYGYWVVAACFAIQGIGIGTLISFGVFYKPMISEFGWTRASLSGASSIAFLLLGAFGICVGRLNDRFGPRVIMIVSGGLLGVGYSLMSQVQTLWQVYLFFGVITGIGLSTIDIIALSTTARWFVAKRGTMTGFVKVGTGAGQMTIPLAASLFITTYGWRTTYFCYGIFVPAALIAASLLLRRDPGQMGLLPDGTAQTPDNEIDPDQGLTPAQAMRTLQFWALCLINMLMLSCLLTTMLHIVPHAIDIGLPAIKAAGALSMMGGVSMLGRFVTGMAIDRIGNKKSMIICFLIMIGSFLWVLMARELWMLYLFAAVYGLAHGGLFTVISPMVAEFFGIGSHGALFGLVAFCGTIGAALGPFLAGHIFDVTSSYQLVFILLTGVAAVALILTTFLKPAFVS